MGAFRGIDGAIGAFFEVAANGSLGGFDGALDNRRIQPCDSVVEELVFQQVIGFMAFGKDEQAGGVAIEAVDQAEAGAGAVAGDVRLDGGEERWPFFAGRGAGQHTGGLGNDEDILIFKDDVQFDPPGIDGPAVVRTPGVGSFAERLFRGGFSGRGLFQAKPLFFMPCLFMVKLL